MWVLMLGYLFLSTSQACIFCRLPSRDLSARLAHLCEQISSEWGDCKTSWNFSTFALDEVSMDRITEKTHRVMTVLEIKGYLFSLPTYWQWLQKSKLPEYMRQALCPPACRGRTTLYNCSTCKAVEVHCWALKRCNPGKQDLREAKILLLFFSAASLIIGFISCIIESRSLLAERHS
ncbi:transmembrane protein 95 isoform X1 [Sarcophilus harrisii]|uniref:Transmembrane protein 95 n=1 Tax=Sarcophilus harrisii TaxID=9305 RepID=A0A7N4NN36_SARHA|nr:transmembrane protein 95 isoform X1 [Sarcophilus harrisii]